MVQMFLRIFSIMVINGHPTTNLFQLSDDTFNRDKYSYGDIKKKISNEILLNKYVKVLARSFELPGCMLM